MLKHITFDGIAYSDDAICACEIYYGLPEEVLPVYKSMARNSSFVPCFCNTPKLRDNAIYGIELNYTHGTFSIATSRRIFEVLADVEQDRMTAV